MGTLVLNGATSGATTLTPTDAVTTTVTFPSLGGTAMVSGNMPAFSAYKSVDQSVSQNVWTKCTFETEVFDTNNNFASSRFTPTIAGYYLIIGSVDATYTSSYANGNIGNAIYKNGSLYTYISLPFFTASTSAANLNVQSVIYFNGSTDYVEMYGYNPNPTASPAIFVGPQPYCYFNGCLLRTA